MPKTIQQGFDQFVSQITPSQNERDKAASHRASIKTALEARLNVSRFFETGSFSHGTGIAIYSDVDVLVGLGGLRPTSPYTALNAVKAALEARFWATSVRVRSPAVVVDFGGGSESWEVIPGYLQILKGGSTSVYSIPAPGGGWLDTAPDAHLAYVHAANKTPSVGKAKRLARLLKAWKYYCAVPVSSFYLEMRAAKYVAGLGTYIDIFDLAGVLRLMADTDLGSMNDPSDKSGRIPACSSEANKTVASSKARTAAGRAERALSAYRDDRPYTAFGELDKLFNGRFPSA